MSTIQIDLPEGLDDFVRRQVESGLYADAADVVRDALRRLVADEDEEAKMAALREALRPGLEQSKAGIFYDGDINDIIAEVEAEWAQEPSR